MAGATAAPGAGAGTTLLNASYDVSRELFAAINPAFQQHWQQRTGNRIEIDQSHAGSSKQAQAILQGLQADVVTFNQITDVQALHDKGRLIPADWQQRLPNHSSPYYSTTAFLVRKGNPKGIKGWDDLVRSDVKLVFPNPKTSGNGRYTYLAAWLHANRKFDGDEAKIRGFIQRFLHNVAVFDTGGRAATVTFAENGIGDVLLSFESEVKSISKEYDDAAFEVIVPAVSILAEFPVAVVDKVADKRGTRAAADAYLRFLYSPQAQDILAAHAYRVGLTVLAAAISVPVNVVFGVLLAWCVTRFEFAGRRLLICLIDIPFAMSPVVAGLCYLLLYGAQGGLGQWLAAHDLRVMFAWPGVVLVTVFITCPYVARLLIPLLQAQGSAEEQAAIALGAGGWQTFRRVTLPNIRWGLWYGTVLTSARAIGEFGAVSVVSGMVRGQTLTLPLHVELLHQDYNSAGAFAAAALLTSLALITLTLKALLEARQRRI